MSLTFKEYQEQAGSTAIYPSENTIRNNLNNLGFNADQVEQILTATYGRTLGISYAGLGLGEAGEVQNKIKKILRDDGGILTDEKRIAIAKEVGGNLWYCAAISKEIGVPLEQIAKMNLDELASRQKRGVLTGNGDNR